ncbi:MAG TPA: bile acid:sodium symporter [Pseudonocardiaceae bacterium]|nr:bile acid:sodium symporter [Pseudonocardiaceae bacterium]
MTQPSALDRHQVAIYLGALAAGWLLGWAVPGVGGPLSHAVSPVLGVLLYVTFLQVPVRDLVRTPDWRFLAAVLVVNFVVVPLVVAALLPLTPADRVVRLGVLLVLLCPCVDYVIVFSGLAGGGHRLAAATPLLLVAQLVLLPGYLLLFLGPSGADVVSAGPFLRAFAFVVAIPLVLAWATQTWAPKVGDAAGVTMVPLLALTLCCVVAAQAGRLSAGLLRVVPVYALFLVAMVGLGAVLARVFRLAVPDGRSVAFSGATRNSLVVLPLALAAGAGQVVVAQTLVEVVGMVLCVRIVPKLVR